MQSFAEAWSAISGPRDGESVSSELRPLLQAVYAQVLSEPPDLVGLQRSLDELLEFLAHGGRTNANCWAADRFFANCEGWERDWGDCDLPEMVHDVFAMMGEALHDTVQAPDAAKNLGCLPEQILARVRNWPDTSISGGPQPNP